MTDDEWALSLARRFSPSGILDRDDYEALALYGLWVARQRFRGGVKFRTYAQHFVKGAILHAMRDTSAPESEPLPEGYDAVDVYPSWQPEAYVLDQAAVGEWLLRIEALPPKQRQAVAYAAAGLSARETADLTHGGFMAVHRALHNGRKGLRRQCENSL